MKLFANIVNGFQPLSTFAKIYISDIRSSSEYVFISNLSLSRKVFTRFTCFKKVLPIYFTCKFFHDKLLRDNILLKYYDLLKRGVRMGQNTEVRLFRLLCL